MYDNNATACVLNVSKEYKTDIVRMKKYIGMDMKQQIAMGVLPSEEALKNFLLVMSDFDRKLVELEKILVVYQGQLPF